VSKLYIEALNKLWFTSGLL